MPTPIDPVSCPPAAPVITATGCDKAILVKICDPGPPPAPVPPAPTTASGVTCAGAAVTATGAGVAQTVPHPTAVQTTKDCDTPQVLAGLAAIVTELQKPEFAPLLSQCRTPDGGRWIVYTFVNEQTQAATNQYVSVATGVSQATAPAGLDCSTDEKVDPIELKGCLAGVDVFGFALLDTITRLVVGEIWRNPTTSAWGAAPAGMTFSECKPVVLVQNPVHWLEAQPAQTVALDPWEYSIDGGVTWAVGANGFADRVPEVPGPAGQNRLRTKFTAPCAGTVVIDMRDDILGPPTSGPNLGAALLVDGAVVLRPTQTDLWNMYNTGAATVVATLSVAAGVHTVEFLQAVATSTGNTWTNTNSVAFTCAPVCLEGKAWYDAQTGQLVKYTTLGGVETEPSGSIIEGGCPAVRVDKFVNPVHWCELGVRIPGGVREAKGEWQYGNFAGKDDWRFYVSDSANGATYIDADVIYNWITTGTSATFTHVVPVFGMPGMFQNIVLTRSQIQSYNYSAGASIEILGIAPTNINPNVDITLPPDYIGWSFSDIVSSTDGVAICKEGKALYTRDAQNQVKLDGVITLDGLPVVVDPLILKEGACSATDCATAAPIQKAFSSGTITGAFTVPAGAHSVELSLNGTGSVVVTGEVNATFAWAGSARKWTAPEGQAWAQAFNFAGTGNTSYEVNYII